MPTAGENIGKRIREIRTKKKLTQEEVAFNAKIDYSYLNQIEAGKRNPSVTTVIKIARALRVKAGELF